jgi:hypothetical protein
MKRSGILFFLSAILLVLVACQSSEVELCHQSEHPHRSTVQFQYTWKNVLPTFIPKQMLVLCYRVINMQKTGLSLDAINGTGYFVEPSPTGLPTFDPVSAKMSSFRIPQGTYKFITFNMENGELLHTSIREFFETPDMDKSEMLVRYKTYRKEDPTLTFRIPSWTDYNYYSYYLQYTTAGVFFDTIRSQVLYTNKSYKLQFTPRELTQQIDIYFNVTKDISAQQFTVDSVFTEISGIPGAFNIANGRLNVEKTYKMMCPSDKITDTDNSTAVVCHTQLHAPGIVPNKSESSYMGPGIMQVMIFCSVSNPVPGGERITKKFQGKINLFNTLAKTPSIKIGADGRYAVLTKSPLRLDIKAEMRIDGEKILKAPDTESGVDQWIPGEENVVPVDI